MAEEQAAPGWYPVEGRPGTERWWDGTAWTDAERQAGSDTTPITATTPTPTTSTSTSTSTTTAGGRCLWCGGGQFRAARFMLNTQGLTFLGWDWVNRVAECRICNTCGFIHWFAPPDAGRR